MRKLKPGGHTEPVLRILDAALRMLDKGASLSLDSVADASGFTKPGLMYHFSTKALLMDALVDHVVDSLEAKLHKHLRGPLEDASPADRILAYVGWAVETRHRRSDLVIFSDPKLFDRLSARWADRLAQWVAVPLDIPPAEAARLNAARLIADGLWFADTTHTLPVRLADRGSLYRLAHDLVKGESPL